MMFLSALLLTLIQYATCWPDFYLYTRNNPTEKYVVTKDNFNNSTFQKNLDTVIIIHGFAANADQDWLQTMKELFLGKDDLNVILVDWRKGAEAPNYIAARNNVVVTAKHLQDFLVAVKIDPKTIYCVGHSLGAHTCGLSAKGLVYRRITGMDPAGPLFKKVDSTQRLDKTDALFVDTINTDGCLGIQKSLGHKTFWPNGGVHQAGCVTDLGLCKFFAQFDEFFWFTRTDWLGCSHKRSYEYYIDSMRTSCTFKSSLCKDWNIYEKGDCACTSPANCASMGYNAINGNTFGDFYLYTNSQEPYCENK